MSVRDHHQHELEQNPKSQNDASPSDGNRGPGQGQDAIVFDGVVKTFGERKVLDGISFAVSEGEALCILGRSGTGKSVTLRLMIGLMKADGGTVKVMGKDVASLDRDGLSKIRQKMGFLFQSAALFDSFSVKDNLSIPMQRLRKNVPLGEIKDAVEEALKQVGLENDMDKMPAALSGGMQKRAGLARALVLQPEVLLVDEPSSGLDRITAAEIDDLLLKVKSERHATMVIVTHDIHSARRLGDHFAVLENCKLLAWGTPHELDERQDKHLNKFISESDQ